MKNIKVLLVSANYPNDYYLWTPWNRMANNAISKLDNVETEVIAPLPYSLPIKYFPYNKLTKIPQIEYSEEGKVHRPRFLYLLSQSLFYGLTGDFYRNSIPKYIFNNLDKPDIIHSHQSYLDGYGVINLCEKWNIPLTIDIHSSDSVLTWLNNRFVNKKFIKTLEYSSKIICISDSLSTMIKELGIDDDKIESVPMGVDIDTFKPRDKDKLKTKYKTNETVLLFVGLLIKRKGVKYLLKAISLIKDIDVNFKLVIIGDGPEKNNLKELTKKLDITNLVEFKGEIKGKELMEWYSLADIFVLPSLAEGRPIAIYEAMASECAIIASNVDGVPEQVKTDHNGFLFESKNYSELSEKIKLLLENKTLMKEMGEKSRERIIDNEWTWEGYAKRVYNVYKNAICE